MLLHKNTFLRLNWYISTFLRVYRSHSWSISSPSGLRKAGSTFEKTSTLIHQIPVGPSCRYLRGGFILHLTRSFSHVRNAITYDTVSISASIAAEERTCWRGRRICCVNGTVWVVSRSCYVLFSESCILLRMHLFIWLDDIFAEISVFRRCWWD